jgi:hypothetical protein
MLFWHLAADHVKVFNYNHYDTEKIELTQASAVVVEFFRGFSPCSSKNIESEKTFSNHLGAEKLFASSRPRRERTKNRMKK